MSRPGAGTPRNSTRRSPTSPLRGHARIYRLVTLARYLSGMLDGEFFGESERRARRYKISIPAVLRDRQRDSLHVELLNFGSTGCRLRLPEQLAVGTSVTLSVGGVPDMHGQVCWSHPQAAGVAFSRPLPPGIVNKLLDS